MSRLWRIAPAIALVAALLGTGFPAHAQQVGVNSAVNPDASGTPPGGATRKLVLGQQIVHDEQVKTGVGGQTQILFLDESAMTVGPNSDVTIDNFVYDPNTGKGQLAMSATAGVLRFVGGKLSKNEDAVTLRTPTATIGVRGGIFIATVARDGPTQVTFLYGQGLTVTAANQTQTITRPGFSVTVAGRGAAPSSPSAAPVDTIAAALGQLSGKGGSSGGSSNPPTDSTVAGSGISSVVSGNIVASVQQATQNSQGIPTTTTAAIQVAPRTATAAQSYNSTVTTQSSPIIVSTSENPTPPGTPITPTPTPTPTGGQISGIVKLAPAGSTLGFTDQSPASRIPYTGTLQNGVATGTSATLGQSFSLSPLTPGATTKVTATVIGTTSAATGTATTSPDGNFFFSNLVANDGTLAFVFGGVPVSQTFFAPTPTQQFYAFAVQPDGALSTGGVPQVIPFLPLGVTASSVSISPLYLVTPANTQFGAFSFSNPNSGIISPKWLQASLAVDGQGSSQGSALLVNTGAFSTSNAGNVIGGGPLRGTVLQTKGSPLIHISSGVATVPGANGNNLFGGNTIDGFVLDQNQYNFGNFSLNLASAEAYNGSIQNTQYAFNQPVLATSLPSGVGSARSALTESGFFGGVMECCGTPRAYALTGSVGLQTDPASSQLAAAFVGTDPFTSSGSKSGLNVLQLNFGSLPSQGVAHARSTFIDNNIYGAMDSAITPSVIQANTSLGNNQTVVLPTYNSAGPNNGFVPSMTMVTAAALGPNANSWMPAGVTPCACQYLQWGYWTARIDTPNPGLTQTIRNDFGSINTWVAGQPTVNMPTSGSASYNGAAIGTVNNNGANYLAAGSFNNTYNFGSNTGTVAINNFDGHNFSGTVTGSGPAYAGAISGGGGNRTGIVLGQFYGPAAAETGGTFAVQATSGPSYIASGIFAGKR